VDGKEIQRVSLSQKGKGSVQIQTRNVPAGTYHYSLVVNGQIVDTKRMVIQR
jgi:outer membrane usher protein FimD/PapC